MPKKSPPPTDKAPPPSSTSAKKASSSSAAPPTAKKKSSSLPVLNSPSDDEDTALQAAWPEAVLQLPEAERSARVRTGLDSVLFEDVAQDGSRRMRGFVRAVLRVPLHHDKGRAYGVFVEVDRQAYSQLKTAFQSKEKAEVWGKLATRLPFLDDAYGSAVCVAEDGSDLRARVIDAESASLKNGPEVGPRSVRRER